jgi:hypothetical protein
MRKTRNAYGTTFWLENSIRKEQHWVPKCKWEENIKTALADKA